MHQRVESLNFAGDARLAHGAQSSAMIIARLREVHQARPFRAFTLQLADGTAVDVPHPECLAFYPQNPRSVIVALPDGAAKIIDLLLVAAVHVGNSRARRPRQRS